MKCPLQLKKIKIMNNIWCCCIYCCACSTQETYFSRFSLSVTIKHFKKHSRNSECLRIGHSFCVYHTLTTIIFMVRSFQHYHLTVCTQAIVHDNCSTTISTDRKKFFKIVQKLWNECFRIARKSQQKPFSDVWPCTHKI